MAEGDDGELLLISDGGADTSGSAAGACLLRGSGGESAQLLVYLGKATNNEAEICAGLVGFSFLAIQQRSANVSPGAAVGWLCDSEYVLKSATSYIHNWQKNGWKTADRKPVKNQGLWRCFLSLSAGFRIRAQHVLGHSGHIENEICDSAVGWARANADQTLAEQGDGFVGNEPGNTDGGPWLLLDGRPFIEHMRRVEHTGIPDEAHCTMLLEQLHAAGAGWFTSQENPLPRSLRERGLSPADPLAAAGRDPAAAQHYEALVNQLRSIRAKAESLAPLDPPSRTLADSLGRLLKKL